jgi:hypothetical protein
MATQALAAYFDQARLQRNADGLAVAVAVSLPWSTSATGILLVLWLIAVIPTLEWAQFRRELMTPAGGLPVLLFALSVLGMAWADVSLAERWKGLDAFFKPLVVPLLMAQFRRSERGNWVFIGFLLSCVVLLIASYGVAVWPAVAHRSINYGVPVKSYIVQSAEFTMCAAVLLHIALGKAHEGRPGVAAALVVLSLALLANVVFVVTSRTTLVIIPALVLLYGLWRFGWKGAVGAALVGLALAAALWAASPYVRERVTAIFTEAHVYETKNIRTSTGERIVFWTKSLRFMAEAPLFGHGTGSIKELFQKSAIGQTGVRAEISTNPHNQTFAVGIQLGLLGIAVLWAMWIAHLLLFRGNALLDWIGLVLVTQNIVGSLFNSFLFDFTEGWIYFVGIGVAAGMVRRRKQ